MVLCCLTSCNTNDPYHQKLIGSWSDKDKEDVLVKTISFNKEGTLIFTDEPNKASTPVIDYAGVHKTLQYTTKGSNLNISGTRYKFNETSLRYEEEPFNYSTAFAIEGDTLTIDSFSYDGGLAGRFYKPLVLKKVN